MNIKEIGTRRIATDYTRKEWLELRSECLTSTDIAALFGISPYSTEFELWHTKKSKKLGEIESNDRMKWGTRLQDPIAHGIAEDNGWRVRRKDEFIWDSELRIGSSFDFQILPDKNRHGFGLLEIKNVDAMVFKDGWILDGDNVEAPSHIEIQLQHQMAVDGVDEAYIGALVGGNRVVLIKRERDDVVIKAIEEKVLAFWESIEANKPPPPDFKRDAEFIRKLYRYAEPGKVIHGTDKLEMLVRKYKLAKAIIKAQEIEADAVKAEIMTLMGDAEKVVGDGWNISAGIIGPKKIAYEREAYRDFRAYLKEKR